MYRLAIAVLALCSASARVQNDELKYSSDRFGFSAVRPSTDWGFYATDSTPGALFALSFFPRGTPGVPGFVVYVSDAGAVKDPEVARDAAEKLLEQRGAGGFERGTGEVAGADAPWLAATMANPLGGGTLAVRCHFRIEHGMLYALQCVRSSDDAASEPVLAAVVATFALSEPVAAAADATPAAWRALAERCAADLGWAESWSAAAERARAERKLVLVVFEYYSVLELPSTARSGPFTDPDFAALVQERFVPFLLATDGEAPFRDPKVFGMGKHSFGSAFLFVAPDGRVVAECSVSNASFLDEFARGLLAQQPDEPAPEGDAKLARAARCLRRGELARAGALLAGEDLPAGRRLRAALARRERRGADALAELAAAKTAQDAALAPELECDDAVIRMRMQRYEEASAGFEHVVSEWPEHPRADEARFWLGAFAAAGGEAQPAPWIELVEKRADSPWAAKAAANLLQQGSFVLGGERLDWPEPELVACAAKPALQPLPVAQHELAGRGAVAWLVAHQRENGAWWNPDDGFSLGANLYTPAISALCATSLIAHRDADGAAKAVERAVAYALAELRAGRLEPGKDLAGVYSIWNRTFVAWLFAHALRAGIGERGELTQSLQKLVDSIVASQDRRGGWPYVTLPGDPDGTGFDPSASFLTAGVALVLFDARDAGAKVPQDALDRALAFLEGLKEDDGSFRYMTASGSELVDGFPIEAAGRGPLCALALVRGGRADAALVKKTLDLFAAHAGEFRAERYKELCHTGPTGFGAHYVVYDYLFAAAAVRVLPAKERARHRALLLEDLLAGRASDGSFSAMPGLGRAYTSAGTLLALDALARDQ